MTPLEIFETKAYYNKWLKQLTENEKDLVLEMLKEAQQVVTEKANRHGPLFTMQQLQDFLNEQKEMEPEMLKYLNEFTLKEGAKCFLKKNI